MMVFRYETLNRCYCLLLLLAAACLPQTSLAEDPQGGLTVDVINARQVPCPDQIEVAGRAMAEADYCFTAEATAHLELRLESETPELLRSIAMARQSAAGGAGSTSSMMAEYDRTTWSGKIPLPRAALDSAPTPDAPLIDTRPHSAQSILRGGGGASSGPLATGHHLIDLKVGPEGDLHKVLLGITITAAGKPDPIHQWPVAGDRARLLLDGCWKRSLDPVVELVLTDCEDPRYQVKVATANPEGKLSLGQYVKNARSAYEKIWSHVSRQTDAGPPEVITLELDQKLAGESHAIRKYFIVVDDRFLVVTFYGPEGEQKRLRSRAGSPSDWLMIQPPT